MTQRIDGTFQRLRSRREAALVTFVTAGDPSIESTADLVVSLAEAGADIVELGIPYSDPLADGPSIQASSQRALDRGMTPARTLEIVHEVRGRSDVPLVLMTSYNLVLRFGLDKFARVAVDAGADGSILTDLPPEEAAPWKAAADAHGLATIFLAAPTSTPERIRTITQNTTGFVYCVSRTGVTGARTELPADLRTMLENVRAATDKPLCVGFGVSTPAHVAQIAGIADGVVIGSALVDFLHTHQGDDPADVREIVRAWKAATRRDGREQA